MLERLRELLRALGRLVAILPQKLFTHTKEVERGRYCKCCGALAGYYVTTAFIDMTHEELAIPFRKKERAASLLLEHNPSMYLCLAHHPFIGKRREETWAQLEHKKLVFHLITPNPFL